MTRHRALAASTAAVAAVLVLAGCADEVAVAEAGPSTTPSPAVATSTPTPSTPSAPAVVEPTVEPTTAPAGPQAADGAPRTAYVAIPALGVQGLEVVPYRGRTDDAAGTLIQDDGDAASPHGPRGGTGPGGIGNYQVTAHRNTAGGPFFALPELAEGARVSVTAAGTTYVYEIVETRETSFRSPASLRAQRAAVPGRPGVAPTQAMLTLSTCATQEDHAAGNYWSDELKNPEHRIDKIGVLVATRPA